MDLSCAHPFIKIVRIIEKILTLTRHAQRHIYTVNKIMMTTSPLAFSWSDKFTVEFSEESQTLV